MSRALFASLVRELEEKLGIALALADDEGLEFQFDGGIRASIAFEEAAESVIVEARFEAGMPTDSDARDRFQRLMLHVNYQLQKTHGLALALDGRGQFAVIGSRSVRVLDGPRLIDLLELAIVKGREIIAVGQNPVLETPPPGAAEFDFLRV